MKFLLKVKIYYKGKWHSKEDEIGYLTLEITVNKDGCESPEDLVETGNSYCIEGERDVIPVSCIELHHCSVTGIVEEKNIEKGYDSAFRYNEVKGVPTFTMTDRTVRVQYGWTPVEE